jgi:hypothetical protein
VARPPPQHRRRVLLRRLLAEWTGITVEDDEARPSGRGWSASTRSCATLGPPVSLQAALLHGSTTGATCCTPQVVSGAT